MFSAVASGGFHAVTLKLPGDGSPSSSIPMATGRLGHLRCLRRLHINRPNCSPAPVVASDGDAEQKGAMPEENDQKTRMENARHNRRIASWEAARDYKARGVILTANVSGFNSGGLLLRFRSILGFLPYAQMSPSHQYKESEKSGEDVAKELVGSSISVKVLEADEEGRKLIFSERAAIWSKYSDELNVGDIYEGKIISVEDYGAFVVLKFPNGEYNFTGLVHISEVSWDFVKDARSVLTIGDSVKVKVTDIDREKCRIGLSMKQLVDDPLLESIDKVILQEGEPEYDMEGLPSDSKMEQLPGLESICNELLQEEGITDIKLGRQGLEKRVVSQDLEIWLSTAPAKENQLSFLARAGRQVQEVHLTTNLDSNEVKLALQRVLGRIP